MNEETIELNRPIDQSKILELIKGRKGLRSTKPDERKSAAHGDAAYVWRMLSFFLGTNYKTQCLPFMADCYVWHTADKKWCDQLWDQKLDGGGSLAMAITRHRCKELDKFVDLIMSRIPKEEWKGVIRWGKALGY